MTTTKTAHEALTGKRASTKIQRRIVGYVGVDAGMIYVGDPSYAARVLADYRAFLKAYVDFDQREQVYKVPYKWGEGDTRVGTPQQAIVVGSGFGDGSYPVTADIDGDGRVRRISIDFDK